MATFATAYKGLNFFDMKFHNGIYKTDDKKEIEILEKSQASSRYGIVRIDESGEVKGEGLEEEEKPKRGANGQFLKKK